MTILASPRTVQPALSAEPTIVTHRSASDTGHGEPLTVIYVAGYGRSGTTLIDIALGEHPSIFGAGELAPLSRHVWTNAEHCACGRPVPLCPVWRAIVDAWQTGEDASFLECYRRAQQRTESILGVGRWLARFGRGDQARLTGKLIRSIADVSGRHIVVDSSKLPGRGLGLAALPDVGLYVVHVVRDARGVAWSMKKPHARQVDQGIQRELRSKPLAYTALRWMVVNLAAEALCRRVGPARSLRVSYEDFVRDPHATLARITDKLGMPIPPTPDGPPVLSPQHQVAGSRHRMQRSLSLVVDDGWRRQMPLRQQRFVERICGPLLRRYGYLPANGGARI